MGFQVQTTTKQQKFYSQEEIERKEEINKQKRLNKMAWLELIEKPVVDSFNQLYNQEGEQGVLKMLKVKKQFQDEEVQKNIMEIINTKGVVTLLKILNGLYLKTIDGCSMPGLPLRVKNNYKHRGYLIKLREKSEKDLEKEAMIRMQIKSFINNK
jgi:hypothetical protein